MRVDGSGIRQVMAVMAIVAIMAAIFGTLHVIRFQKSNIDNYYRETAFQAQIFAEQIRLDSPDQEILNLTRLFVRDKTVFAQVIRDGEIVARDPLGLSLEDWDMIGRLGQREGILGDDTNYLDVYREIPSITTSDGNSSTGYVRLGFSFQEIETKVLQETLLVIMLGFGAFALVSVSGIAHVFRRSRAQSVQLSERDFEHAHSSSPPSNGEPVINNIEFQNGSSISTTTLIEAGPLKIVQASKEVFLQDELIELSPKEYELLSLLATAPDRVFSNREILEQVWADGYAATAKDVKQYIYLLRRKLEDNPEDPELIVTVRGFGYKLDSSQENGN
jgi:DNA-binding winged helix-turn-helix (wHTH) protein